MILRVAGRRIVALDLDDGRLALAPSTTLGNEQTNANQPGTLGIACADRSSQPFSSACPTLRDAMMAGDWGMRSHEAPIQFNGTLRNKHHDPRGYRQTVIPATTERSMKENVSFFLWTRYIPAMVGSPRCIKAGYPGRKEDLDQLGTRREDRQGDRKVRSEAGLVHVPQLHGEQRARTVISYMGVAKNRPFG